jgi:DNA-binding transcriptional ArsR family regulator
MKRILYWLIAGTRGGETRARIIHLLNREPQNANQISENLGLDYKTVRHHLDVLLDNRIITSTGRKYAKMFFISPQMEENWDLFQEIWDKLRKK